MKINRKVPEAIEVEAYKVTFEVELSAINEQEAGLRAWYFVISKVPDPISKAFIHLPGSPMPLPPPKLAYLCQKQSK